MFSALVIGCGGGGGGGATKVGAASKVTVTPATLSLDFGQVSSLSVVVADANNTQINAATFIFQSDNAAVTVSNSGLVCAGTWDSLVTPVVCTPATTKATANVVATSSGIASAATVVSVHPHIATVTVSATAPPAIGCVSQGAPPQPFSIIAKDSGGFDITSQVGTPTWVSTNISVGTIDANGLLTAKQPGVTSIFASINGNNSTPINFEICAVQSISITPTSATGTQTFTPTVIDRSGATITGVTLSFLSSQPTVANVSAAGAATAGTAGSTGIVAACSPNLGCNAGLSPVYSNLATLSVAGSSPPTMVYVTGKNATSIIPVDTGTNVAGTAITVPQISAAQPTLTSFVFNKTGAKAYIGATTGMLILDPTNNTIATPITSVNGTVLSVSPNGGKVVLAGQDNAHVFVFDTGNSTVDTLTIAGATGVDWSTDSFKAFIAAGSKLYAYPPASPLISVPTTAATDVTLLTQGSVAYVAGGSAGGIGGFATCNNSPVANIAASPAPRFIASTFDSTRVIGVNTTTIYDVGGVSVASGACPPAPTNSAPLAIALGVAPATINQLILSPDATRAFVLSDLTSVLQYNAGSNIAPTAIPLTGGSATTGSATLDSKNLYVGIKGTNTVQRIDTSAMAAVASSPITVTLGSGVSPDFVVIRPK